MIGIKIIDRGKGSALIKAKCREIGVSIEVIRSLVKAELDQVGKRKKRGLTERIDEILADVVEVDTEGGSSVPEIDSAA